MCYYLRTAYVLFTLFFAGLLSSAGFAKNPAMEIIGVGGGCHAVGILTTGSKITITGNKIEVKLRIDTATNSFYELDKRPTAYILQSIGGGNENLFANLNLNSNTGICEFGIDNMSSEYLPDDITGETVLENDTIRIEIHGSGLMFIRAKKDFDYKHIGITSDNAVNMNLSVKHLPNPGTEAQLNRMWIFSAQETTDEGTFGRIVGGSLHAIVRGSLSVGGNNTSGGAEPYNDDFTIIHMKEGDVMAHMSFPPRRYDFDRLYGRFGTEARPFVQTIGGNRLQNFYSDVANFVPNDSVFKFFSDRHVGTFFVSANVYEGNKEDDVSIQTTHPRDIEVSTQNSEIIKVRRGYEVKDKNLFQHFIRDAHSRGFKVIAYTIGPKNVNWCRQNYRDDGGKRTSLKFKECMVDDSNAEGGNANQCPKDGDPIFQSNIDNFNNEDWARCVLLWMEFFQNEYKIDGWYLDGPDAGGFEDDYFFIRKLRYQLNTFLSKSSINQLGDHAIGSILYFHDSIDPWAEKNLSLQGLKAIFLRAYADYSLSGEVGLWAKVSRPDDDYYKYYTNGYGMDQAICAHKLHSSGEALLEEEDNARAMSMNYYCAHRSKSINFKGGNVKLDDNTWETYFLRGYELRRDQYRINPSVPPALSTSAEWYKKYPANGNPSGVEISIIDTGSSVSLGNMDWTCPDKPENSPQNVTAYCIKIRWNTVGLRCGNEGVRKEDVDYAFPLFRGVKLFPLQKYVKKDNGQWEKVHQNINWLKARIAKTVTTGTGSNTQHIAVLEHVYSGEEYAVKYRCASWAPEGIKLEDFSKVDNMATHFPNDKPFPIYIYQSRYDPSINLISIPPN